MYMIIENIKMGLVKMLPLNNYSIEEVSYTSYFYQKAGYSVEIHYV